MSSITELGLQRVEYGTQVQMGFFLFSIWGILLCSLVSTCTLMYGLVIGSPIKDETAGVEQSTQIMTMHGYPQEKRP